VRGGKRPGAGRPKGTTTLPATYWLAVLQTVDEVRRKRNLSILGACKVIHGQGGIKWIESDYPAPGRIEFKTRTEVLNARTLSNRYHQARQFLGARSQLRHLPQLCLQQWSIEKLNIAKLEAALATKDPAKIKAVLRERYDEHSQLRKRRIRKERRVFSYRLQPVKNSCTINQRLISTGFRST
jgi:hypothetical protein